MGRPCPLAERNPCSSSPLLACASGQDSAILHCAHGQFLADAEDVSDRSSTCVALTLIQGQRLVRDRDRMTAETIDRRHRHNPAPSADVYPNDELIEDLTASLRRG